MKRRKRSVKTAGATWSSSMDLTENSWPVRDFPSATIQSPTMRRSALSVPSAARISSCACPRRDAGITAVWATPSAISWCGRSLPGRNARAAAASCWKKEHDLSVRTKSVDMSNKEMIPLRNDPEIDAALAAGGENLDTLHAARNVVLLDNTRKIEKLIHNNDTGKVVFNDICKVMSEILQAHILVISKKGKVLGVGKCREIRSAHGMITEEIGTFVDPELNTRLLDVLSTHENVALQTLGFFLDEDKDLMGIVLPIEVAGERLGTVFIYKDGEHFDIDDIILSEYGTTVVGLEMLRAVSEETAEESRKIAVVKSAISTLSYTEMHAIIHIFEELDGVEGILVASKIADKAGITRSVVVNALRKFESAGVIESRSSGMKGTYIKVLNDAIYGELAGLRKQVQP